MRLRVIPVFGTSPSLFGLVLGTYALMEPEGQKALMCNRDDVNVQNYLKQINAIKKSMKESSTMQPSNQAINQAMGQSINHQEVNQAINHKAINQN